MGTPGQWPFQEREDAAALSDAAVVDDGAPVLRVVHHSDDGGWAFLSGEPFSVDRGRLVAMREALALDPGLRDLADLPPGWVASRDHPGAAWRRAPDPEV